MNKERYLLLWLANMLTIAPLLVENRVEGLWIPGAAWFQYLIFKYSANN